MDRVLNYRVWDEENNQMLKIAEVNFLTSKGFSSHRCWFNVNISLETITGEDPEIENEEQFNNLKWMQAIDLKDKKDSEIYEGDIVRLYYGNDSEVAIVKQKNSVYGGWEFKSLNDKQAFIYSNDIEVIGNIYENPELMEK